MGVTKEKKEIGTQIKNELLQINPKLRRIADSLFNNLSSEEEKKKAQDKAYTNLSSARNGSKRMDNPNLEELDRVHGKEFPEVIIKLKELQKTYDKLQENHKKIPDKATLIIRKIEMQYQSWPDRKNFKNIYFKLENYRDELNDQYLMRPLVAILMCILWTKSSDNIFISAREKLIKIMRKDLNDKVKKLFPSLDENYTEMESLADLNNAKQGSTVKDEHFKMIFEAIINPNRVDHYDDDRSKYRVLDHYYKVIEYLDFNWTSLPPKALGLNPKSKNEECFLFKVRIENNIFFFDW